MIDSDPPGTPEVAPQKPSHLQLNPKVRQDLKHRLSTVLGHIRGIEYMLDAPHPYCVDILTQLKAVHSALGTASDSVLQAHLEEHVATRTGQSTTDELIDELMALLKYHQQASPTKPGSSS